MKTNIYFTQQPYIFNAIPFFVKAFELLVNSNHTCQNDDLLKHLRK